MVIKCDSKLSVSQNLQVIKMIDGLNYSSNNIGNICKVAHYREISEGEGHMGKFFYIIYWDKICIL